MPTSLSPTDICNLALQKIGAMGIASMTDGTNTSAIECNKAFQLAYLSVARETRWNCILATAVLVQVPQTPLPDVSVPAGSLPNPPAVVPNWAPNTMYAASVWLQYGGYYYFTAYAYTSSNNFIDDLTSGALLLSNLPASGPFGSVPQGSEYASGWAYSYQLPADFVLMGNLNDYTVQWDYIGGDEQSDYEIIGPLLYCDEQQAVIKYVQNVADTTKFDALFTDAMSYKLAAMIATPLRQDGGRMEAVLLQGYAQVVALAKMKNAGERMAKRFNPISSSKFNQARYGGVNG